MYWCCKEQINFGHSRDIKGLNCTISYAEILTYDYKKEVGSLNYGHPMSNHILKIGCLYMYLNLIISDNWKA